MSLIEDSVICHVCEQEFTYEISREQKDQAILNADLLPDGFIISGSWVCTDCGSCSDCGNSLEKSGNMFSKRQNKLCKDCKFEKDGNYYD